MKTNVPAKRPPVYTHEGAPAKHLTPHQQLARSVATCMLWEDNFYESGETIADRIKALVPLCTPKFVADCAIEARSKMNLRHAPLLLAREMARSTPAHRMMVGVLLPEIIQRADELAEFLALYWKDDPNQPISKQVKIGLREAFNKFDEYQLAKYNRDGTVKLRDVAFLTRVKPKDPDLVARLVNRDYIPVLTKGEHLIEHNQPDKAMIGGQLRTVNPGLKSPGTWENRLSAGEDKKTVFTDLVITGELRGLAFLRNLRNMRDAGVSKAIVRDYATKVNISRILPFRFIAAAKVVPDWEDIIEPMMLRACEGRAKLPGTTVVMLDVSSSMDQPISAKSDLMRIDAAIGLGVLLREVCEDVKIVSFSDSVAMIAPRRGFALADAIRKSQPHFGTELGEAVRLVNKDVPHDRLIVLTDEQAATRVPDPRVKLAYMINVASHKHGVGYGKWSHIDGWSEAVLDYIENAERSTV